ncbi:hypothetical protein [Georgenia sp. SUBG003]|uniref:hypothetical protein n=1 Tax=Georgenia sp. SUBG003 TaxID=1497974 RepID=UPI003AB406BB
MIRMEMEEYSRRRHVEAGYSFVNTPHITKAQLFETSRHLEWYADGMYPRCTWTRRATPRATSPGRARTTTSSP